MTPPHPVPRIAVVGSMNIDLIAYTSRVPEAGETIIGTDFAMGFGGKGANQAVMARLLGADVSMVGCLGDDAYAEMTRANFAELGVDASHVATVPGPSGVAPIWVEPDGTNRIIVVSGANDQVDADRARAAVAEIQPDVLIGQFEIPQGATAAAFAEARAHGAVTVLNPAPGASVSPELLSETDWIIPNEGELSLIAGYDVTDAGLQAAATELGCRLLVTLGDEGAALVLAEGGVQGIPAVQVEAVDTTGAGDSFVGAFAFALASRWDEVRAIEFAVACSAESVTQKGTQTSFPRGAEALDLIARFTPSPADELPVD